MQYLRTAASNFKPGRNASFRTYFYTCMKSMMMNAIREQKNVIAIPIRFHMAIKQVSNARQKFLQSLGREPSPREIAEVTKLREGKVMEAINYGQVKNVSFEDAAWDEITLHETLSEDNIDDERYCGDFNGELAARLKELLETLPDKERTVLEHRYGLGGGDSDGMTASATSRAMGCVRTTVHNLESKALEKLRSNSLDLHNFALELGYW